jgi:type IV secretory pathway component VirB8
MENRIEELRKEGNEEAIEYLNYVKASVADKSYFNDALDWYFFRCISPICDRTYLTFGAILAAGILYFLFQMYSSAYPLVQKIPVFINSSADANNFSYIYPIKSAVGQDNQELKLTGSEIVAQYLVKKYVETRESYDYSKSDIADVNNKFTLIKNTSSADEYKKFQLFMSKDNPTSPIQNFGKNISKTVRVDSVRTTNKEDNGDYSINKAKEILIAKIPDEAEVRFVVITKTGDDSGNIIETKDQYFAKVNFDFAGIDRQKKGNIKFIVKTYRLFKIK